MESHEQRTRIIAEPKPFLRHETAALLQCECDGVVVIVIVYELPSTGRWGSGRRTTARGCQRHALHYAWGRGRLATASFRSVRLCAPLSSLIPAVLEAEEPVHRVETSPVLSPPNHVTPRPPCSCSNRDQPRRRDELFPFASGESFTHIHTDTFTRVNCHGLTLLVTCRTSTC